MKTETIIFIAIVLVNGAIALWKKRKERAAAAAAARASAMTAMAAPPRHLRRRGRFAVRRRLPSRSRRLLLVRDLFR